MSRSIVFPIAKVVCSLVFLAALFPQVTQAASMSLSPNSGTHEVGSSFSVNVIVGASDAAFNAASGRLQFPADLLEVVSISKSASVISLWVQEPSFSSSAGSVSFEGIVLNPGYKGSNGKIISVQLRVKQPGTAKVSFTSGEVLANDGVGTSILSALGTGSYALVPKVQVAPVSEEIEDIAAPVAVKEEDQTQLQPVKIVSNTHKENSWSREINGTFSFDFGDEVIAMRLLADNLPDSTPVVVYQPPIKERSINDLSEGQSYLHVQLKDRNGWGEVIHYSLQIDTKPPKEPSVLQIVTKENADATFLLTSQDETSGVDHYEIKIDGGDVITVPATGAETYFSPQGLVVGIHTLEVEAFDKAGNSTLTSQQFEIFESSSSEGRNVVSNFLNSSTMLVVLALIPLVLLIGVFLWLYLLTRARQQE